MKPYIVRLFSDSTVRLNKPLELKASGNTIRVQDLALPTSPAPATFDRTWQYTVYLSAENAKAALAEAEAYVKYINDLLGFIEGAAIADPKSLVAIDVDERAEDRTFAQPLYPDLPQMRSRRPLTLDRLRKFYSSLNATDSTRIRPPLERALHLYRRSFVETDPLDQFQDLWSALEALNPLIRDRFSSHRKYPQPCPNCHKPLNCADCGHDVDLVDNSSGIRYVVSDMLGRQAEWSELRHTRVKIAHSLEHALVLAPTLSPKLHLMRNAVVRAILALVKSSEPEADFLEPPLPLSSSPSFMLTGTIHDLPAKRVRDMFPAIPHFVAQPPNGANVADERVAAGIVRTSTLSIKPQGFTNQYSYGLEIIARRGPRDDGMIDASLEFEPPTH